MGEDTNTPHQGQGKDGKKIVGVVLRSTAKTIHFVRHAEGTHNKAEREEGRSAYSKQEHFDAKLTDFGKEQCASFKAENHAIEKEAQLVVVSPLTRAIQTALLTIEKVQDVPWIALECARERAGHHVCDRRRPVSELRNEFPAIDFDFMEDDEDKYWQGLGNQREKDEAVVDRVNKLFAWLSSRSETNIAVVCFYPLDSIGNTCGISEPKCEEVTHSSFLSCLFNVAIASPPHLQKWFANCELRTILLDL